MGRSRYSRSAIGPVPVRQNRTSSALSARWVMSRPPRWIAARHASRYAAAQAVYGAWGEIPPNTAGGTGSADKARASPEATECSWAAITSGNSRQRGPLPGYASAAPTDESTSATTPWPRERHSRAPADTPRRYCSAAPARFRSITSSSQPTKSVPGATRSNAVSSRWACAFTRVGRRAQPSTSTRVAPGWEGSNCFLGPTPAIRPPETRRAPSSMGGPSIGMTQGAVRSRAPLRLPPAGPRGSKRPRRRGSASTPGPPPPPRGRSRR